MKENETMIRAVEMDLRLTEAERKEVIERLRRRGFPPDERGRVGPRIFAQEAREVLRGREADATEEGRGE